MVYESFNFIDEGVVYGIVEDINSDKIKIKAGDDVRTFDNNGFYCKKGDYVRIYINNDKIIYLEIINKDFYEKIKNLINN